MFEGCLQNVYLEPWFPALAAHYNPLGRVHTPDVPAQPLKIRISGCCWG